MAVPLRTRLAPHLFLAAFICVFVVWVGMTGVPRAWGDTLYNGPMEDESPVPFHAAAGDRINFRLEAEYPERTEGDQDANLTVRDAEGNAVYRTFAGFIVVKSGDATDGSVTPPIPAFHPNETGAYTVTWNYTSGTPSENSLKIVKDGFVVERSRASGAVFLTMLVAIVGAVSLLGVRTVHDEPRGRKRFWPVQGANAVSLALSIAAGFGSGVLLILWVGGVVG